MLSSGSSRPPNLRLFSGGAERTLPSSHNELKNTHLCPAVLPAPKAKPAPSQERMPYLWCWKEHEVVQTLGADIFVTITDAGEKQFKGQMIDSQCEKFSAISAGSLGGRTSWPNIE